MYNFKLDNFAISNRSKVANYPAFNHFNSISKLEIKAKVLRTVDVSYGGENGFNQAIELVADDLQNVKFIQEKKLICKCFRQKNGQNWKCSF